MMIGQEKNILYPDSDGKRLSENMRQYRWIVTLESGITVLLASNPNAFAAADNLIYAKKGDPKIRYAPDVYVAFGRPKGERGSYKVWEEGGIFPQVIFEVLSPGNTSKEMARKFKFYDSYGAEEYYIYDPDRNRLQGWVRDRGLLEAIQDFGPFTSPRLGIRFVLTEPEITVIGPDGKKFLTALERATAQEAAIRRANRSAVLAAEADRYAAEQRDRAEAEHQRAAAALAKAERLEAKLRELGLDPDS
jgi:Uma2 family endonuclease